MTDLSTTGGAMTVAPDGEIVQDSTAIVSPAEAKDKAVAAVTMSAYARASELKLTKEEDAALAADFPDEAFRGGAGGDDRLIYIEHAYLRDRLNDVLGRGAWSLVTRSKWTEQYKTAKGADAVRVYAEVMLMVRGCFVSEAVGEMDYYPHNGKTTYADAIEGSKTAAFRRCAKDFGVGLQAWKRGWCEGWWKRKNAPRNGPPPADAPADAPKPSDAIVAILTTASKEGLGALQKAWEMLTIPQKKSAKDIMPKLKADALARDQAVEGLGDANEG